MKRPFAALLALALSSTSFADTGENAVRMRRSSTLALLSTLAESDAPSALQRRAYDGSLDGGSVKLAGFPGMYAPPPPRLDLTPPSLTPNFPPIPSAPVPAAPLPAPAAPRAVEPQPATPYQPDPSPSGGGDWTTPCQDLRDKAARLEGAADSCDADVAGGAPYCHVTPTFHTPSIPRSLSSGEARGHASRYRDVASRGDEQACRDFGGEGVIPYTTPTQSWILRGLAAVFDTRANLEVKWALTQFVLGRNVSGIDYGPGSYWTERPHPASRHHGLCFRLQHGLYDGQHPVLVAAGRKHRLSQPSGHRARHGSGQSASPERHPHPHVEQLSAARRLFRPMGPPA